MQIFHVNNKKVAGYEAIYSSLNRVPKMHDEVNLKKNNLLLNIHNT